MLMENQRVTSVVRQRVAPQRTGFSYAEFFAHKDRLARLALTVAFAALVTTSLALVLTTSPARSALF